MTPFAALAERLAGAGVPFRRDVPLGPLTWLGVGGPTPLLAEPRQMGDLDLLHREASRLGVRLERLGSGANLLVQDAPLPFAVLRLSGEAFREVRIQDGRVTAGAGAVLEPLIWKTLEAGLAGLEGLVGIPATLGGGLAMNAGSRQVELSGRVRAVTVADDRGVRVLDPPACGFGYRRSALLEGGVTVVEAAFDLSVGDAEVLRETARGIREAKRRSQPLQDASAGCMFRNPPGDSAGRLIEAAGLKGLSIGRAGVSPLHANFIVNLGGATADEFRCLIDRVRDGVRLAHGIDLELEVRQWP